jgi:hypothetical protein
MIWRWHSPQPPVASITHSDVSRLLVVSVRAAPCAPVQWRRGRHCRSTRSGDSQCREAEAWRTPESISANTGNAPRRASSLAVAAPIPPAPPVIRITFSLNDHAPTSAPFSYSSAPSKRVFTRSAAPASRPATASTAVSATVVLVAAPDPELNPSLCPSPGRPGEASPRPLPMPSVVGGA